MYFKKITGYIIAYLFWIIVLLLALWLVFITRSALLGLAAVYYFNNSYSRQVMIIFLEKSYILVLGLAWLALMIICEETFRKAVRKGNLLRKFSAVCGVELLVIFVFDFVLLFLQHWALNPLRLFVFAFEFIFGVLFVLYWRSKKTLKPA